MVVDANNHNLKVAIMVFCPKNIASRVLNNFRALDKNGEKLFRILSVKPYF